MANLSAAELFDPAFLRSLEHLAIVARRLPAGGRLADQRSRARGAGVEFTDVRAYVPGDDFRTIDWHVYERLDRVFVRQYLEDEHLPVHILLDHSASMQQPALGGGSTTGDKFATARQTVAALAWIALQKHDIVRAIPFAETVTEAERQSISSRGGFQRLLAWLSARDADGATDLAGALHRLAVRRERRGLCIVVSDFLDPIGVERVVSALGRLHHTPLLVRVAHEQEERPELQGELQLVDSETGETLAAHVDEEFLDRYQAAWEQLGDQLQVAAAGKGGSFLTVRTNAPLVPQIAAAFRDGVLEV